MWLFHTEELLLSAGPRQMEEARRLWGSVFEVVHLGVEDPWLPPLRRVPCCVGPAEDASWPVERLESLLWGYGVAAPSSLKWTAWNLFHQAPAWLAGGIHTDACLEVRGGRGRSIGCCLGRMGSIFPFSLSIGGHCDMAEWWGAVAWAFLFPCRWAASERWGRALPAGYPACRGRPGPWRHLGWPGSQTKAKGVVRSGVSVLSGAAVHVSPLPAQLP